MLTELLSDLTLPPRNEMGPLLITSILLIVGVLGGMAAARFRMPRITGNIIIGLILGQTLFHDLDVAGTLQPLSLFAMSLIATSIGSHLSYRRLHNALRRIIAIAVGEVIGTVLLVSLVAYLMTGQWQIALLLGCMSADSAPATTVGLIRESRAKGSFVKTLLSVVAIDNILCILLFAFALTVISITESARALHIHFLQAFLGALWQLIASFGIGMGLGRLAEKLFRAPGMHDFSALFVCILLAAGVSSYAGLSPLLTCLFFGMYLGNRTQEEEAQLRVLEPIELLLFTCFFTLAGISLHLEALYDAGWLCVAYLIARFLGKACGAIFGGIASQSSYRIWSNISIALVPQAGVAIGLVVLLTGDPAVPQETAAIVSSVILAAVTVNEIIGPFLTRMSLRRTKEAGLDRPRLMEFLQEEYILVGLEAQDKWDALRQLTDFYGRTHHVSEQRQKYVYETIIEREMDVSTGIGKGVAIPHGRIEEGHRIDGVLGISRKGIDFDSVDGEPVHIVMLIVTPQDHETRHLEVLASLAAMVEDDQIRNRLVSAINANDAWEIIEYAEVRDYNYFIEDPEA